MYLGGGGRSAWRAPVRVPALARHHEHMTDPQYVAQWEYARLEYRATGSLGTDKAMDWQAIFHTPTGVERWGTDERFNDLPHLNRAGAEGWEAYHRAAMVIGQPQRLNSVTYSLKRAI